MLDCALTSELLEGVAEARTQQSLSGRTFESLHIGPGPWAVGALAQCLISANARRADVFRSIEKCRAGYVLQALRFWLRSGLWQKKNLVGYAPSREGDGVSYVARRWHAQGGTS